MAISVAQLKTLIGTANGGPFALSASQLGIEEVTTLFDTYLPKGELALAEAEGDPGKLSVSGEIALGGEQLSTEVSFATKGEDVSGIAISIALAEWKLAAPPLVFSAVDAAAFASLSAPRMTLAAQEGDDPTSPQAALAGEIELPFGGAPSQHEVVAPLVPSRQVGEPVGNLAFAGEPKLTLSSIAELAKASMTGGGKFESPPVKFSATPELTQLQVIVDPGQDVVLMVRFSLESDLALQLVPGKFEIESLTLSPTVQLPTSPSPSVYGSLSTTMEIDETIELDLAVSLLETELFIEGTLGGTTPIKLHELTEKYSKELAEAVPQNLGISVLSFGIGLKEAAPPWRFNLEIEDLWELELGSGEKLDLERLTAALSGEGTANVDVLIGSCLVLGPAEIYLNAARTGESWSFGGGTLFYEEIEFVPLLDEIGTAFGLGPLPPNSLTRLELENVQLEFERGGSGEDKFEFECAGALTIAAVALSAWLELEVDAGPSPTFEIKGALTLAISKELEVDFKVEVKFVEGRTLVVAGMEAPKEPLRLEDLLEALELTAQIPPALEVELDELGMLYAAQPGQGAATESTFLLTAGSQEYGQGLLALTESGTGATDYLFALEPALTGPLSHIPLVGQDLPPALSLSLERLQVLLVKEPFKAEQVSELDTLLEDLSKELPAETLRIAPGAIESNAQLSLALKLGETPSAFVFGAGGSSTLGAEVGAPAPPSSSGHWLSVQKSLGPLFLKEVGFEYDEGSLEAMFDGSLNFSGLEISLTGLSFSAPLSKPCTPGFGLRGLGVSLQADALSVDGAFVSMTPGGLADANWEYGGELTVETPAFALSAIGAYGKFEGHPSFFAFAVLDIPLGGPPFFFVTGLAGGFGYNRGLALPPIDKVAEFPLVAAAVAGQSGANPFSGKTEPAAALAVMQDYLPEQVGESWFAVGVQFSSFELIQTFALLSVAFGTEFEVAVLGLSSVTVPTDDPEPIAFAQLALEISFASKTGLLAAAAELTPASFVLAPACHLTGGFAFYSWLAEASPEIKAGDFVVTFGGYYPGFAKPTAYPSVPIIGANWQVCSNLAVKGGVYFALIPSAVMAGGYLEATWSSGNLKAWYSLKADFLLSWKPFHYQAAIAISLGVSYRLNLGFASHTFTVHLGASLALSGPPFSGKATIDLDVIKFTIAFGSPPAPPQAIPWSEFKQTFLPPPGGAGAETLCTVGVAAGMVKDLTATRKIGVEPDWVVDPESFRLVTRSAAPCTSASLVTGDPATGEDQKIVLDAQLPDEFGVGPVGVADRGLSSEHTITIHKLDGNEPDTKFDVHANCVLERVSANVPRAPWSKELSLDLVREPSIATVNAVPATIPGLVTGYSIAPKVAAPDETPSPIDLALLRAQPATQKPSFTWSQTAVPSGDDFDQAEAMSELMSTIANSTVAATRTGILTELAQRGVPVATSVEVGAISTAANQVLIAPPLLSLLGEERAN